MEALDILNILLIIVFLLSCGYRFFYVALRLLGKKKVYTAQRLCRYAVLICARNEEAVIGHLLDSISMQDYPSELIHTFVAADNCTDDTARVAREHGAVCYERFEPEVIGKGHALAFLLDHVKSDYSGVKFDGYFVFDADNLLNAHYITEINKAFSSGYRVVTGYRNTKNLGDSWVSFGYGIYFAFESEHTNRIRDYLCSTSFVSGTGYAFADDLLTEIGGWNYSSLSEDFEFTAEMISRGEKIAYCSDAILYDEQPTRLRHSIHQRSRWIKGYFQMFDRFFDGMTRALFERGSFGAYDMLMNLAAIMAGILTALRFLTIFFPDKDFYGLIMCLAQFLLTTYAGFYMMSMVTIITEHERFLCPMKKLILYSFTYPFFMYSFCPVFVHAVFSKPQWKPVIHKVDCSIQELEGSN